MIDGRTPTMEEVMTTHDFPLTEQGYRAFRLITLKKAGYLEDIIDGEFCLVLGNEAFVLELALKMDIAVYMTLWLGE